VHDQLGWLINSNTHSVASFIWFDQLIRSEENLFYFFTAWRVFMSANSNTVASFEEAMMSLAPKWVRHEDNKSSFDEVRHVRPSFSGSSSKGKGKYSRKGDVAADYAAYASFMNS